MHRIRPRKTSLLRRQDGGGNQSGRVIPVAAAAAATIRTPRGMTTVSWNNKKKESLRDFVAQRSFSIPSGVMSLDETAVRYRPPSSLSSNSGVITTKTGVAVQAQTSTLCVWESTTQRLLKTPVGCLDSMELHEVERAVRYWAAVSKRQQQQQQQQQQYPEGQLPRTKSTWDDRYRIQQATYYSFELLDRLEEEIIHIPSTKSGGSTTTAAALLDMLTDELVALVVKQWRQYLRLLSNFLKEETNCHHSNKKDDDPLPIPTPKQVLERVESYAANAPYCQPTTPLYTMILDAMGSYHQCYPSVISSHDSHREILELLDHMQNVGCAPEEITWTTAIRALSQQDQTELALQIFQTMKEHSATESWEPTLEPYGSVIGVLARTVRKHNSTKDKVKLARQAECLLQEMQQRYNLVPNTLIYSYVLQAWAQTHAREAGECAEAILKNMLHPYSSQQQTRASTADVAALCKPNNYCFSAVMFAYAKSGNVEKVEELMQQLQHLYHETGDTDFFPNVFCFNALIEAWSHHPSSNKLSAANEAEKVLGRMEQYATQTGKEDCLPNLVSFNLVLHAHAEEQGSSTAAAERAMLILHHMKNTGLNPDTITYNCILDCLANARQPKWAERAQQIVEQEMTEPDQVSYLNVVRAWAAVGDAQRAEAFLRKMCQYPVGSVRPGVSCFNSVMSAWSKTKHHPQSAGHKAEALLRYMKLDQNIYPDIVTYNALMDCWCAVASHRPEAALRALSILRYLQSGEEPNITPNVISFTTCLWAFASAKMPDEAESLFQEMRMISAEDSTVGPNLYSYCAVISAWANIGCALKANALFDELVARANQDTSLKPNTEIYSALLHAWSKAGDVEKATSILQDMCDAYKEGTNKHAEPNERCFSAVIGALSRSRHPDAAPQAEACLVKMQEMSENGLHQVRPNVYTFQSVISAWANSDFPIAAEQAEANLQRLKDLYYNHGDKNCKPNVMAYTNTLRAWSRAATLNVNSGGFQYSKRAVERSEALLDEMLQSDIPEAHPNHITFGTVLRTVAESQLPDKSIKARRIVQKMRNVGLELDTFAKEQVRKADC